MSKFCDILKAKDFIDIHYIEDTTPGTPVDPETDFIPICANCHRMLHRKRSQNISLEDLKKRVHYYQQEPDHEQLTLDL